MAEKLALRMKMTETMSVALGAASLASVPSAVEMTCSRQMMRGMIHVVGAAETVHKIFSFKIVPVVDTVQPLWRGGALSELWGIGHDYYICIHTFHPY
jgi:hypothetical protein